MRRGSIVIVALVALVLVFAAASGYFFLQTKKDNEPNTSNLTSQTQSPSDSSPKSSSIDETANWKTYTGKYIKLSFKIPTDYSVDEQKGVIQNTLYDGLITVKDENADTKFAVIIAAIGSSNKFLYSNTTTIDGLNATRNYYCQYSEELCTQKDAQKPYQVLVTIENMPMVISYLYNKNNEALMDQVLNTVKFE